MYNRTLRSLHSLPSLSATSDDAFSDALLGQMSNECRIESLLAAANQPKSVPRDEDAVGDDNICTKERQSNNIHTGFCSTVVDPVAKKKIHHIEDHLDGLENNLAVVKSGILVQGVHGLNQSFHSHESRPGPVESPKIALQAHSKLNWAGDESLDVVTDTAYPEHKSTFTSDTKSSPSSLPSRTEPLSSTPTIEHLEASVISFQPSKLLKNAPAVPFALHEASIGKPSGISDEQANGTKCSSEPPTLRRAKSITTTIVPKFGGVQIRNGKISVSQTIVAPERKEGGINRDTAGLSCRTATTRIPKQPKPLRISSLCTPDFLRPSLAIQTYGQSSPKPASSVHMMIQSKEISVSYAQKSPVDSNLPFVKVIEKSNSTTSVCSEIPNGHSTYQRSGQGRDCWHKSSSCSLAMGRNRSEGNWCNYVTKREKQQYRKEGKDYRGEKSVRRRKTSHKERSRHMETGKIISRKGRGGYGGQKENKRRARSRSRSRSRRDAGGHERRRSRCGKREW